MKRCAHGVYQPDGDEVALSCMLCNPAGIQATDGNTPVFNHRGAMTLSGKLPKCPSCGTLLTSSRNGLCVCGIQYELVATENLRANNTNPGVCPGCHSGIHYVKDKKTWTCADCGQEYKAPKKVRG